MEGINELSKLVYWGLGACVTGFLFLCGWLIKLQIQMSEKVSYKWIEEKFERDIKEQMSSITTVLTEIKNAVVGSLDKPGIINRLHDVERDVKELQEK